MLGSQEVQQFLGGLERPQVAQEECLLKRIVDPNRNCEYGRKHAFGLIRAVDDYRQAVPICQYEDLQEKVERMKSGEVGVLVSEPVRRFFLTSGSTSVPKFIPVTNAFIGDKLRAFGIYWSLLRESHPNALRGKMVTNLSDSSADSATGSGIPCSSESSFWSHWAGRMERRSPLPEEVCRIKDVNSRYYTIGRILAEENVSLMMALNPSTLVLLLDRINTFAESIIEDVERGSLAPDVPVEPQVRACIEANYTGNPARARELRDLLRPNSPRLLATDLWPDLSLVACWRSPMLRPYLDRLEPHLKSVAQRDYISMASEGILAIPVEDGTSGGVLATSIHFYEFIEENQIGRAHPETLLADQLEVGHNYAIVLSTSAGLYRYNIGDVMRVRGFSGHTPILEFLHRSGSTCSLTGEKLTEDQVTAAVSEAATQVHLSPQCFTLFPAPKSFPHYVLLMELASPSESSVLKTFLHNVDRELSSQNIEYTSKRKSQRLGAPELWLVPEGSFEGWTQRRVAAGANHDQIKPTHLTRDPSFHTKFEIVEHISAD